MKKVLYNLLLRFSAHERFQRLLERNVIFSQNLMGIGSGTPVYTSGEKVLVDKLRQCAKTGPALCILDVGANKGQFLTFIAGGLQGTSFNIHAFEPSEFTYKILCENAKDYPNVTLNNMGLGKEAGEFELFYNEAGSGLASLSKRRVEHYRIDFKLSEKIRIETLDNYCQQQGIKEIDLLKLDVEGHELDVLQGGVRMLIGRKIRMISFEFGGCNIDSHTYFQDFYYFFKEIGMNALFRITPSGYLVRIRRYNEIHEQFRTTNFLVLRDESKS